MPSNWKAIIVGGCIGVAVALTGVYFYSTAHHIEHLPEPSEAAVSLPLKRERFDSSWVKQGTPNFRATWYTRTDRGGSGIWECDGPSTFEWRFSGDEHVYVLEGGVDIEYLGNRFHLKPGDSALFLAGTTAVWHVPNHLKKSFTIHRPNKAVRLYRQIAGII